MRNRGIDGEVAVDLPVRFEGEGSQVRLERQRRVERDLRAAIEVLEVRGEAVGTERILLGPDAVAEKEQG
jgi:hypothetical protein